MSKISVSIIMGSQSDWPIMKSATIPLNELGVSFETRVVSAHRTPDRLYQFTSEAHLRGIDVIIAGAGGSAHLAGMAAAMTHLPVIAVPVPSKHFNGMDSLMSMVQMPKGVAVACQAVGNSGAYNAGLLAAQMLALKDDELSQRLQQWRKDQTESVPVEVE
ncbi:MAG: 5-(carboxyamino)imidazole ribonucleotide mutase [Oceanospirillales bacterium LUC14_002_19_P2]|nr:MAG: 5-(carboxyamino)imidazole ribonucleotide mutase [Oceanospirillales bacterium LUC14_002_19_P2]